MFSAGNSVSAPGQGSSTAYLDEDASYNVVLPRQPTKAIDASSGEAAGTTTDDEHVSTETTPIIRESASGDTSEGKGVHSPHLENLKEKPPDDNEEEAMDTSQTRKRPAPYSEVERATTSDVAEQVPFSNSQCVACLGGGGMRRLCQRPQEIAAKRRGPKAAD
ncbi:hypothetical protein HPB50_020081 [Hyalomma asiaticum]|uniref:Uncharacterized protein n=1 Tax=Hyalomma asiaticum TaxID=266040 RepID=A0ACB7TK77_HYAAI|nr:hypothetical protein HPB50_020081 [Hyalomma asiaticum]